jgi:Fe-S cluster biogenesis protein NfuA
MSQAAMAQTAAEKEDAVRQALRRAEGYLRSHGGTVELRGIDQAGVVEVKFGGMCLGCPARPVTVMSVIRRCLAELDFVSDVQAVGVAISSETRQRLEGIFPSASHARSSATIA